MLTEITRESLILQATNNQKLLVTPAINFVIINGKMNEQPDEINLAKMAMEFVLKQNNNAAGLAAPQVGSKYSWFVMACEPNIMVVNPSIIGRMGSKQDIEGCFSVRGLYKVKRATSVTLEYWALNLNSNKLERRTKNYNGFNARVVQHEYAHLMGVTLPLVGNPITLLNSGDKR